LTGLAILYREERREVEESRKNLEIEGTRKVDENRKKIEAATVQRVMADHRLKDAEKEKLVYMRRQIEDLKRESDQESVQIQGEVLEHELEPLLKKSFLTDYVEPVPDRNEGRRHHPRGRERRWTAHRNDRLGVEKDQGLERRLDRQAQGRPEEGARGAGGSCLRGPAERGPGNRPGGGGMGDRL